MATKEQAYGSTIEPLNISNPQELNIAIVVADWNEEITSGLLKGAVDTLKKQGLSEEQITVERVPGSFELVYGCKLLCETYTYDAVIAIGSVIRGETSHFDYVCGAVSTGIAQLNLAYPMPTIFCVLTDDNKQQAIDRSGGKYGNKGEDAAIAALQMSMLSDKYNIKEDIQAFED